MASSTSGNPIPATEAVQVSVSSLADESPRVRDSSMSSLKDIASLVGNIAGLFPVMAYAVRFFDKKDVDSSFMSKLAKITTGEMVSSKYSFFITKDCEFFDFLRIANSSSAVDIELSYSALSTLEDVIAILSLVTCLHNCTTAISDKIKLSAGAVQAAIEFVSKRGVNRSMLILQGGAIANLPNLVMPEREFSSLRKKRRPKIEADASEDEVNSSHSIQMMEECYRAMLGELIQSCI
ncbi:hypothetical protein RJ641_026313 [Dillenia turbinata]|uniref:Uncharacterized protein n=1 Tax=Dillenia turbinata TaxID=194707 RepID=A0AAN8ZPD2_9MAGN